MLASDLRFGASFQNADMKQYQCKDSLAHFPTAHAVPECATGSFRAALPVPFARGTPCPTPPAGSVGRPTGPTTVPRIYSERKKNVLLNAHSVLWHST